MTEPAVHQALVRDLGNELDPQRLPRHVLGRVPTVGATRHPASGFDGAAGSLGPVAPRMAVERIDAVGLQRLEHGGPLARRHARRHTHVVQHTGIVVEAEQQRADALAVFVEAVARDRAVARALVLHLQHCALPGTVRVLEWLGDDTVESRALEATEPVRREVTIARRGRQVDRRRRAAEQQCEPSPTLAERCLEQRVVSEREEIERDVRRGHLGGELADT